MSETKALELFVSPNGNDAWSGRRPTPNARRTDGPLATLAAVQRAVRRLRKGPNSSTSVRVNVRGGTYFLDKPLVFGPGDGGSPMIRKQWRIEAQEAPVTYCAYRNERPVISGGKLITGWKNAVLDGKKVWVAPVPAARAGKWNFRQLFVGGRRAFRPSLPSRAGEGDTSQRRGPERVFRVKDLPGGWPPRGSWRPGNTAFEYSPGDIEPWHNLTDVEVVALHLWMESRVRLSGVDPAKRLATVSPATDMAMIVTHITPQPGPYYIENVREALAPGQWYLDRPVGKLYYMPLPGERIAGTRIIAPVLEQVMILNGEPREGKWIDALHFEGLTFAHAEWRGWGDKPNFGQASHGIPGGVVVKASRGCSFRNCRMTQMGDYGLELLDGCRDVTVQGCLVDDNGGGGIKVWHASRGENPRLPAPPVDSCRRISILDCEIANCGHIYHSAVGVLIGRCSGNRVLHNHIHHLYYTGISVGWTWGYGDENNAYGNVVEHNHVHHIGQGMLSDMGGIYTLGLSQGSRIRHNVFHDVVARDYGGWGIYPDEGTTGMLIENNLVFRCNRSSFHQHFGRDNLVVNNIFAFAGCTQLAITRNEPHMTAIFRRNIVYFNEGTMVGAPEAGFMEGGCSPRNVTLENNLYWHAGGGEVDFLGRSLAQWRKLGFDAGSVEADPKFVGPRTRSKDPARWRIEDFRLRPNSPVFKLGFREFDLSQVGPRPQHAYRTK
jgi:hypothetical protein